MLGRCPGGQARSMSWFRTSWGAFSRSCSEVSVWCQTSTRVPIESNFYNTCPTDMKLNQSRQDMSLLVVIQFGENPGCNKKVTFKFLFLVLSSQIVNVPFCHRDSGHSSQKDSFPIGNLVQQQAPTGFNCPPTQLMKASHKLSLWRLFINWASFWQFLAAALADWPW